MKAKPKSENHLQTVTEYKNNLVGVGENDKNRQKALVMLENLKKLEQEKMKIGFKWVLIEAKKYVFRNVNHEK